MYRFGVELACIDPRRVDEATLAEINESMVLGLTFVNDAYMRASGHYVPLYESGVRYRGEKRNETWRDFCSTLRSGWGNCKEFVAWRVAELWQQGIYAMPKSIVQRTGPNHILFHVVVEWPDGSIEDPSAELGM